MTWEMMHQPHGRTGVQAGMRAAFDNSRCCLQSVMVRKEERLSGDGMMLASPEYKEKAFGLMAQGITF